ncbi:ATP-dependent DNA helicase MER3 [Didymosphaeria variabile]|uniref:ATP-dependent DNA helicase MER3 n=1 Tax=Didymosphaeria variabile TaxID=1932322 RepID=A0A9W8XW42_9PLEO|nr:ATP-dependent DNA helicase MER3 [Didymosphaeria variabile]KAJ4360643.1 ATP-dependent DNA helicase MER3 [Didymosphaeria variabile]
MFPPRKTELTAPHEQTRPTSNISRRRTETPSLPRKPVDEFDDGIDDDELVKASLNDLNFDHIDNYANPTDAIMRKNVAKNTAKSKGRIQEPSQPQEQEDREPRQLENGKWACKHLCKDKNACKHLCCKHGMDKPPKKTTSKRVPSQETHNSHDISLSEAAKGKDQKTQIKLQLTASKRKSSAMVEELDLTQQEKKKKGDYAKNGVKDFRELEKLHKSVQMKDPPSSVSTVMHQKPSYCYGQGGTPDLSFLGIQSPRPYGRLDSEFSSDYDVLGFDDLSADLRKSASSRMTSRVAQISKEDKDDISMGTAADQTIANHKVDLFDDDNSMISDIMWGAMDSEDLKGEPVNNDDIESKLFDPYHHDDYDPNNLEDQPLPTAEYNYDQEPTAFKQDTSSPAKVPMMPPEKGRSLFLNDSSSSQTPFRDFKSAKPMLQDSTLEGPEHEPEHEDEKLMRSSKFFEKKKVSLKEVKPEDPVKEEETTVNGELIPEAYKGLEPWLFQEFGDIVEIVD